MNARSQLLTILIVMGLLTFFSFCKKKTNSEIPLETIQQGPFTIQKSRITEKQFNMNHGRSVKAWYSKYQVLYKGKEVIFPEKLQVNTGYSSLWKAYILADAARPAIIAGSQSVYLITEEDGAAVLKPLSEQSSSFASLQWLDAENGQPGTEQEIYISDDTTANYFLRGGQYLLINKSTVLQLADLSTYSFEKSMDLTDEYYAGQVVAFSPGKDEIVFVGEKQSPERYDKFIYALLVYNYKTNAAYTVPFDQTETRLNRPDHITADWISTYFGWQENSAGNYVLQKRMLAQLPYWQGLYNEYEAYELNPVQMELQTVLLDFIKTTLSLTDADIQEETYGEYHPYRITYEGQAYTLGYQQQLSTLSFSRSTLGEESEAGNAIIRKIGDGFNEILRQGQHQELFTSF